MEYLIVPESEANIKLGKIAISSPVAQGLIGKKVGDTVQIKVPSGSTILFRINFHFNLITHFISHHGLCFFENY